MPKPKRHIEPKTLAAVNQLCDVMSNELRRDILWTLTTGPRDVSDLAKCHDRSITHVSNCLRLLKEAGLVQSKKDSTRRIYSLTSQVRAIHHEDADQLVVESPQGVQVAIRQPASSPSPRSAK